MKPHITVEFLRGLLFSYVAYHLYTLCSALFFNLSFPEGLRWLVFPALGVPILIYAAIGYSLLYTPRNYARFVTIFLAIALLVYLLTAIVFSQYRPPGLPSPINRALISQLVFGTLIVGVAYAHQVLKNRSRANDAPAA